MTTDLTVDDVAILLEALDTWETGERGGEMIQTIMEAMLNRGETPESLKQKSEKRLKETIAKERVRKERSIFLKAKLLTIKQSISADMIFDEAKAAPHQ